MVEFPRPCAHGRGSKLAGIQRAAAATVPSRLKLSLRHQSKRLEQGKRCAVPGLCALEQVRPALCCAEVGGSATVKHEKGGKLEPPRRVTVQEMQQAGGPSGRVAYQQAAAADDAQQRWRVATTMRVTVNMRHTAQCGSLAELGMVRHKGRYILYTQEQKHVYLHTLPHHNALKEAARTRAPT